MSDLKTIKLNQLPEDYTLFDIVDKYSYNIYEYLQNFY